MSVTSRPVLELRTSPWRNVGLLAVSLIFVATGVLMVRDGEGIGWFVLGFFGLCALVFALQLLPGTSRLRLDQNGFTVTSLFRSSTVRWSEVARFFVAQVGGRAMVCWDYAGAVPHSTASRRLSRALAGVEAGLPDTYGLSAEALASLLEDWRQRHASHPP
jgi:hypothetical protein